MLNLLKFKGKEGAEAYDRYVKNVSKMLEARGARILYAGKAAELLVGDKTWDAIVLVEYSSRKAFLEMVNSSDYRKVHIDREQGLKSTVLYATSPMGETDRFSERKIIYSSSLGVYRISLFKCEAVINYICKYIIFSNYIH